MKQWLRIVTHMIVSGASLLFFANLIESSWEFVGYILITMLLAALLCGLRSKVESFLVFVGSHFLLFLGGIFVIIGATDYKWYIVIWCFWILYSAILRLVPTVEWLDKPVVMYVALLGIEYLLLCALELAPLMQWLSLISTFLVFLLQLLYRNLESMDEFIYLGSFFSKVDEQGIRKMNGRISILYTGILGGLLAIAAMFRVDSLWQTVLRWIRSFIRFLVSLIPITEQLPPEEEVEVKEEMSNMLQQMMPGQEIPEWMQLLQEIFRVLITLVIVGVIVVGIVYAMLYVYRHFYTKKDRQEGDKVVESISFGKGVAKERKPRLFERIEKNPAKRIRRIYKKRLKRIGAKKIYSFWYMSPNEQVQLLRRQGMPDEIIEEIRDLYEKARYSEDFVTDTEVERMRAIL